MLLVGAAAEERDAAALRAPAYLGDGGLRLGSREAGEVARDVLLPGDLLVEELAQQRRHRAELLQPDAHALLANAAWPEPHDEHAVAVVVGRWLVDALGDDVGCAHRVVRVTPPSTTSVWPVTQRASSLAR